MVVANVLFQVSMDAMTRDVTAIANVHPLSGILSNLGVILWCTAASICGFAAIILRDVKPRGLFWFLLSSSLLSAYLLLDDFLLFHEKLAPWYLGLSEKVIFAALGIVVFAYFIAFRRMILRTNFGTLFLALGFLTISVFIDVICEPWLRQLGHWTFFFEDGAKWLGIAFWCSYYVHTCHGLVVSNLGLHEMPFSRMLVTHSADGDVVNL
jgi:hypothetical protein